MHKFSIFILVLMSFVLVENAHAKNTKFSVRIVEMANGTDGKCRTSLKLDNKSKVSMQEIDMRFVSFAHSNDVLASQPNLLTNLRATATKIAQFVHDVPCQDIKFVKLRIKKCQWGGNELTSRNCRKLFAKRGGIKLNIQRN